MVRPMLSDCCPVLSVCLSVCNVGVLLPNGWMDHNKGTQTPIFGPCLLWPNGWKVEGLEKRLGLSLARSWSRLVTKIRCLGLVELQVGLGLVSDQKSNVSVLSRSHKLRSRLHT